VIVDAHYVVNSSHPISSPKDVEEFVATMDRAGVDRVIAQANTGWPVTLEKCLAGNRDLAATVRRAAGRIVAIAFVNPTLGPRMLDHYRECVEEHGMIGFKCWITNKADDPVMAPFVEYSIAQKKITFIHSWYQNRATAPVENKSAGNTFVRETWAREPWPHDVITLARRYPEAPVVQMHYGGNAFEAGLMTKYAPRNVFQVASANDDTGAIELQVKYLGARRVIWGTDGWRWSHRGCVTGAALSDEEKRLILGENMARLLAGGWYHPT
jgi:uncharacterized protein